MTAPVLGRPCKYCLAAYPILFEDGGTSSCEFEHRDDQRVYDLAAVLARVFQRPWPGPRNWAPSDEQIAWFLADADAVVDDFDPAPSEWSVRRISRAKSDSDDRIELRLRISGVTYVLQEGGKGCPSRPVRLATFRQWQREAEEEAARHR